MSKLIYFAVKWGDSIRVSEPVKTADDAKRDCYGLATPDMEVVMLGIRKRDVAKLVRRGLDQLPWRKS